MQVTYPGVYVREVPSGVRTVTGVSTSVALFVGESIRGPLERPTRVTSYTELVRRFGESHTHGELSRQVRQFFLNGGREAWVVRIGRVATEPAYASVTLQTVLGASALRLVARDAGLDGNTVRTSVDYDTATPDATFNLTLFRERYDAAGVARRSDLERFEGLSMDPASARFAPTVITQGSSLVTAESLAVGAGRGRSASDRVFAAVGDLDAAFSGPTGSLRVRVGTSPALFVRVNRTGFSTTVLQDAINDALAGLTSLVVAVTLTAGSPLEISADGDVVVERGDADDLTRALGLGLSNGGIEVGAFAQARPAPNGLVWPPLVDGVDFDPIASLVDRVPIVSRLATFAVSGTQLPVGAVAPTYEASTATTLSRVRSDLEAVARALTTGSTAWSASVRGGRLVLLPTGGDSNAGFGHTLRSGATELATADVAAFGLRMTEARLRPALPAFASRQVGVSANELAAPTLAEYTRAFETVDREVDLFNLLVLPRTRDASDLRESLWPSASAFCERRRAFLLVDPTPAMTSRDAAESAVGPLRRGIATQHAALYFPRVRLDDGSHVDPSGSIAGLMARTDASRGVWKAPAGTEATLRGVVGVLTPMSDIDNGVLNPLAVNAIRAMPNGVVAWGARTLAGFDGSGEDDYRYVPVRRLALFIEESLYRGLRFAVFEPNDEPLWRQIRLAAGAFMANLFRQGAFAGRRAEDAYYVKCDAESTIQNDVNLGIVNVLVGFAPLKPAEFVVLQLQQIAGQVQT